MLVEILSPRCFRETNVNSGYEDNADPSLSVQTTVKKLVITNNTVRSLSSKCTYFSTSCIYTFIYFFREIQCLHI